MRLTIISDTQDDIEHMAIVAHRLARSLRIDVEAVYRHDRSSGVLAKASDVDHHAVIERWHETFLDTDGRDPIHRPLPAVPLHPPSSTAQPSTRSLRRERWTIAAD